MDNFKKFKQQRCFGINLKKHGISWPIFQLDAYGNVARYSIKSPALKWHKYCREQFLMLNSQNWAGQPGKCRSPIRLKVVKFKKEIVVFKTYYFTQHLYFILTAYIYPYIFTACIVNLDIVPIPPFITKSHYATNQETGDAIPQFIDARK